MKTGMQDSVMNEKNILMMTNSSFITKLWDSTGGTWVVVCFITRIGFFECGLSILFNIFNGSVRMECKGNESQAF